MGGFDEDVPAAEDDELCLRLRSNGWRIWSLDAEMARHDAAMTRLGQWWRRCQRAGFAYAEGVRLHGAPPERHWVRESRRAWLWGLALPAAIVLLALAVGPAAWGLVAVDPAQVVRLALGARRDASARWARAFFLVAGKFPEEMMNLPPHPDHES